MIVDICAGAKWSENYCACPGDRKKSLSEAPRAQMFVFLVGIEGFIGHGVRN